MASLSGMTPTPPPPYPHMAPVASPQQVPSQSLGMQPYAGHGHGYSLSFDAGQHQPQMMAQPPAAYAQSFPNGPMSNAGFARSFGEAKKGPLRGYNENPQIYTAVYSGVSVYELEVGGVACMRRRSDGWLNATQILKVAGVDKGKRTKVLEKEILTGEHEKVQGGYGKYQGTWVSYQRGREFCRQYGVEDILRPLLDYDIKPDGSGGQAQDTPTKEQAMAAQRKRFYNANPEARPAGPASNGTFFSNISPSASVALAAMSKAARLNSPAPRPANSPQKHGLMRHPSQVDGMPSGSQQSVMSDFDQQDSGYGTQPNGEPPRKRMRADDGHEGMGPPGLPFDTSMRSMTPTEPNESFLYDNALMQDSKNGAGEPIALPPLPSPVTDEQQEKMNLILDLFAEQGRTDYAAHPALTQLSNEDLNMPLDASANNALHWAATLAKVPLLRLLIQRGASIWRGNAAGQSPLISAVLVNNCWEHSCFPELLELLGPLIEVRDLQGRTILHHIAVSSGIKGRAPSSKYYLEALLEFLVRIGTQQSLINGSQGAASVAAAAANVPAASQHTNGESPSQDSAANFGQPRGPVTFVKFLQCIVNARDKAGNSALNLAARINNRSIIQQLLEIHADPGLPNNKGISAKDFGVGSDSGEAQMNGDLGLSQRSTLSQGAIPPSNIDPGLQAGGAAPAVSQVDDLGQDVISSMTAMLTQNLASHKELLRSRGEQIDRINDQIHELSALRSSTLEELNEYKTRIKSREERQAKIANLRREVERKRTSNEHLKNAAAVEPEWLAKATPDLLAVQAVGGYPTAQQVQFGKNAVPDKDTLQAYVNACNKNIAELQQQASQLRSRSTELEAMYRKVISLCTGVPEDRVEESLPSLVAAVESERGSLGEQEVGRVRDFLRKVDSSGQQALDVNPTALTAAVK